MAMRVRDSRSSSTDLLAVAVVTLALGLAGCASSGGGGGLSGLFGGGSKATVASGDNAADAASGTPEASGKTVSAGSSQGGTYDSSLFLATGYCPPVEVRVGTEALPIYERGHDGDDAWIRFQGSITKTARECHTLGDTLTIKVGIAGRLTAGPKGSPGNFTVPLRVAVVKQHGDKVFYSQMSRAPVSITAPIYASDFAYVIDNISFKITPADRDLIVYVGYDEGKPKAPPGAEPKG
jgi:hypothetical protein